MRHTITITIVSDRPLADIVADIADTLIDVVEGFIGDPEQHAIYGAELVDVG